MSKVFFFLFFIILTTACSNRNKLPKDVFPQQKMEAVLWDLVRAREYLEGYGFNRDSTIDSTGKATELYDQVFRIHQVSKEAFEKSYSYYQDHPALMKEMLDSLGKKPLPEIKATQIAAADSAKKADSAKQAATLPFNKDTFNKDSLKKRRLLRQGKKIVIPV
jgi:hypothetical protein